MTWLKSDCAGKLMIHIKVYFDRGMPVKLTTNIFFSKRNGQIKIDKKNQNLRHVQILLSVGYSVIISQCGVVQLPMIVVYPLQYKSVLPQ